MDLCRLWRLSAALAAAFLLLGHVAWAQAVTQSGPILNGGGHAPMYLGGATGQSLASVMDSGPAAGGPTGTGLSEKLLQARGPGTGPDGTHDCDYSGYVVNNPTTPNWICWDANALGGGLIDFNSPTGQPLQLKVNGIITQLPQNISGATNFLTVAQFGAKCDGVTPDSAAFQSAVNASALGGGVVWQQPTGHACVINAGLMLPGGTHLSGAGGLNWTSPIDNVESDWTKQSSWLHCEDTSNPCISILGNSTTVDGFNYWYTQPTPAGGNCGDPCTYTAYSPTVYPYTIYVAPTANVGVWITNNSIANSYNGVDWEGPSSGVTGIYSGMDRNNICALGQVGSRFHLIDNTLTLSRLRYECWWFQGNSQWWYAMQGASHVDWDVEYLANPQITDVEFTFGGIAMKFTDACVVSGFGQICFATSGMQAKGVSFNENCQAMTVASNTTHVTGVFDAPIAYSDSTTSPVAGQCARANPYFFNLASDNVDLTIDDLQGGFVQSLAFIGGGSASAHGQLHLRGPIVSQYSAYASGAPAVATDTTGSFVDFNGGTPLFFPGSGAGPLCSAGATAGAGGCQSNANSFIGQLEIGGATSTSRELFFTQLATPQSPGFTLGTDQWGMRADASGNLYLDRFNPATGAFIDPPWYVVPLGTGANNTQFQITGQAVVHGGLNSVPITIAQLLAITCSGPTNPGLIYMVSNAPSGWTPNTPVGSTGSTVAPAYCNNSAWTYL